MKKTHNLLIISSFIFLLIILFRTSYKAEIDSAVLKHIETDRAGSEQEKHNRQYLTLAMFQQTGFVFSLMLIPIGFSIYQNRAVFSRYKRKFRRAFQKAPADKTNTLSERLMLACPNLTSNDLILCNFLYKGLSSKEIALQLNISPSSANTARYRLRKKLKIPPDVELTSFLHKI